MRNNIIRGLVSGLFLMSTVAGAQNYSENELSLAYAGGGHEKKPVTINRTMEVTAVTESSSVVDYPTISYPETAAFAVEKEKAFYHLSWQVIMNENLSYTEVQSSTDGVNFTTVGVATSGSDYFVPSDRNTSANYFRLVQYGLTAQKHISEVMKVK